MAVVLTGRKFSELLLTIVLSFVIGTFSLLKYVIGLITYGSTKWCHVKKRNERPEILDSEEYGTHHWMPLKKTRLKLHYVDAGRKDKPLMLFLHGFPEFWYSWRHQLKEFSKDYRTIAIDMRGYGDSDKPSGVSQYTMDKLTDDVDQLIHQLGYEKCILVAHDWGGMVAWAYAILYPTKVERLIICNIPHPLAFEKHLKSAFSQLKKSWYIFLFQNPVLPIWSIRAYDLAMLKASFTGKDHGTKPGVFTSEDIELYKYTYAEYSDVCGPINYYRALLRYGRPVFPKSKLQVPTLMIWGTKDGALEKKMADMSGNYVEDYTLRYIEGASHWVQQEEPQQVNAFIREFLKNKKDL